MLFPSWGKQWILAEQSEVLVAMMTRSEAIDIASKEAPPVPRYQKAAQRVHTYDSDSEMAGQPTARKSAG